MLNMVVLYKDKSCQCVSLYMAIKKTNTDVFKQEQKWN